jgi:hypothetical protein
MWIDWCQENYIKSLIVVYPYISILDFKLCGVGMTLKIVLCMIIKIKDLLWFICVVSELSYWHFLNAHPHVSNHFKSLGSRIHGFVSFKLEGV